MSPDREAPLWTPSADRIARARITAFMRYVEERSLRSDAAILARTVPLVLGRSGVDHADGVTMNELQPQ